MHPDWRDMFSPLACAGRAAGAPARGRRWGKFLRAVPSVGLVLLGSTGPSAVQVPEAVIEAAQPPATAVDLASVVRAAIDARAPASGARPSPRGALDALYGPGQYGPLWLDSGGRPLDMAREALRLLGAAAEDGLDPADYEVDQANALEAVLREAAAPPVADRARFDVMLSAAMLRYLRDLDLGKVDPRTLGLRLHVPPDSHDFSKVLADALSARRLGAAVADLAPPFSQYRALRNQLTRYRRLAADGTIAPPTASSTIRPGEPYGDLATLRRYLETLGDLSPDPLVVESGPDYAGPIVDGVKRFQARHGLDPDGIIGPRTLAALRTPLSWRVRQIELALERLRWLPHETERRLIAINIPMFRLWAWDSVPPHDAPSISMQVIVGSAVEKQTPVFAEQLRQVIFRPYWNIPDSILREEILPALEQDPDYIRKHDMEIVRGAADDAEPVEVTEDSIAALRAGALRLRQRPGPQNALGLVKFVFPNVESIYMHDTPAPELFSRSRRDFSHGCVRVQDPAALAEWVLKGQSDWTRERILAAMAAPDTLPVTLSRPIDVLLFYTTAAVMPEDDAVWFVEDIYGHDARLDRALATRAAP